MPRPERLQRRPAVSCVVCRRRKVRCDRKSPCGACVRTRNESCIYECSVSTPPLPPHEPRLLPKTSDFRSTIAVDRSISTGRGLAISSHSSTSSLVGGSPAASHHSGPEFDLIKSRIRHLEDQISKLNQDAVQVVNGNPSPHSDTSKSGNSVERYGHQVSTTSGHDHTVRHTMYKSRLYGRSHWMNGASQFKDLFRIYTLEEMPKAKSGFQRCKVLAKMIKSQRSPSWPPSLTTDLPQRNVADKLVDWYLRTIESIYRILHIPTFLRDYDAVWTSNGKLDTAFMVQLKLVLAIGAIFYDDKFSLRLLAIQWVVEARCWLSAPDFKSRLSIQSLQTNILFLIARDMVAVGEELVWISAGSLLRSAIYMGLHREPHHLPNMSTFAAEMRRRLWNTILEIALQSSMDSGGPPLISLDDFDTSSPGNYDDDQIIADGAVAKPDHEFTQASVAVSLRKVFPIRLAIAKFLNDTSSHGSYEETIHLDKDLRSAYKPFYQSLQAFCKNGGRPLSQFESRTVNTIASRYLLSLHIPFVGVSPDETVYAFSRKVVVEAALKIWNAMNPSSSIATTALRTDTSPPDQDAVVRLIVCGSGFFRTVTVQASLMIGAELRTLLRESQTLGPTPVRPDLLTVLKDAKTLMLRCVETGETNVKSYLLICLISAQIDVLMRGRPEDELPQLLFPAADEAITACLAILESKAGQCGDNTQPVSDEMSPISLNLPDEFIQGWDFMTSNLDFDFGCDWQVDQRALQELPR